MKLQQGDTVDRYEVERVLGAGGTAMVYRVRHVQLGTRHALKLLTISGESIQQRLMQEGHAQANLAHLNIVAVTDIIDVDGSPGLLMEHIEGPTLEDALADHVLSLRDAETLFRGMLSGVRAAHRQGIIHRDLKPANVLLDPTPDGYVPKVTDFGLAKAVRGSPARQGNTRQGVAMGTPSYMAPEQIRDAGNVDQRADIFSLGCVLYELIARQRAFSGDDVLEIYTRIAQGHYVPVRQVVPDLPMRFVNAIQGCLQVDRAHRIPDCDTLEEVLLGLKTWRWAREPTPPPDLRPPPTLRSDVPPLQLAPRAVDGGTPMAVPREHAPAVAVAPSQGRRPLYVGAALVGVALITLVVALVVAAIGISVPFLYQPAAPARVEIVGEPVLPRPVEPVVRPAVPAPAVADPVEPEPTEEPVPAAPSAPVATPGPAPAPAPVPAAPRLVQIKLSSKPALADVFIDGRFANIKTPNKLELAPGKHQVMLRSGRREERFTIDVRPGRSASWCFDFSSGTPHAPKCP